MSDMPVQTPLGAAVTAFADFATPGEQHTIAAVGDFARLDLDRQAQSGKPEVIYAASKTPEQVVAIAERLLAAHGRVIVSRLGEAQHEALVAAFAGADGVVIERGAGYPTAIVRRADAPEAMRTFVELAPTPGTVLLWESWLRHEVPAGTGKGERISISFNYR